MNYSIEAFFDKNTSTLTYVVYDTTSRDAIVIDPVLDYDQASSTCTFESINRLVDFVNKQNLKVGMILETHAHADHLTGANQLAQKYFKGCKIGIGERIRAVQSRFKDIYHLHPSFKTDGSQFDRLFKDEEEFKVGTIVVKVLFTPGHTPACVSYIIGDAVFTGDALFMPDSGTGRCDFPGGEAKALYHSIAKRLYQLPDQTRVFVGHDYQPNQRALAFQTTIGESKAQNIQLKSETSETDYVGFRTKRDATLSAPKLLYPSIQINIAAGAMPTAEANGQSYLKTPISIKN